MKDKKGTIKRIVKNNKMVTGAAIVLCATIVLYLLFGSMTGIVVDAETGKPIEGAVIAVKWTVTKGMPGLTYGLDYKISEAVTDKAGKFRIWGPLNPLVNPPIVVVYKRGYVAWLSYGIFPGNEAREDFRWTRGYKFRLDRYNIKYSHDKHISFFSVLFSSDLAPRLHKAYQWEEPLARKERYLFGEKAEKHPNGYASEEIWDEVVNELYLQAGDKLK